ncbi:MAG: transposase, partial [Nitrospirae bacterium]|nr:transposase [Nitrospirota bacterium]
MAIADNLRSHTVVGVKAALEAVGAHLRYLPPYSPDLNPIEKRLATLKALLRKAATCTVDVRWNEIGRRLDCFTPDECTTLRRLLRLGKDINPNCSSDERGRACGFRSGACAHPVAALAFHRRAASIMPARREQPRRLPRSLLRIAPADPPGCGGLSVSFVVAVWPPRLVRGQHINSN